jgi:aspartyl-tRNA(Asn)/glutamyl-tRNA(Gln) amidotransferase subunit A
MEISELSAAELNSKLLKNEIGFSETVESYIQRIEEHDPNLNIYISKTFSQARSKARQLQKRSADGEKLSSVAGIPFAVKDNMCVRGTAATCGSRMLEDFIPPYTATAVERLLVNDAVLLGKLNMDEFAMGGSNETSYFGPVKNPWDTERVPGGSSGGCTAAVSAHLACFALGSDTGGSIRQPSSFCGVTGMKPTYGRVSRYGLVAFASSLDQIGPITGNVQDCASVLGIISGRDDKDSTSSFVETSDFFGKLDGNIKGMKFAYPAEYFGSGLDQDVKKKIYAAFKTLTGLGAEIEEVSFPLNDYAIPAYYIISSAEASSNLSRYDGIKYGHRTSSFDSLLDLYVNTRTEAFGSEVKRRIMLGTYALSSGYYDAYYMKAIKVRNMIRKYFHDSFKKYDAFIGPVAPTTAYKIGEKINDPLQMYLGDIYTVTANIAGDPAISVPAGLDAKGLPIGLHIMTDVFEEQKLLDIALAYQNATDQIKAMPRVRESVNGI